MKRGMREVRVWPQGVWLRKLAECHLQLRLARVDGGKGGC